MRLWWHRLWATCQPPAGKNGDRWTCPRCGIDWEYGYVPDVIPVTSGVMDAGGDYQWYVLYEKG